MTKNEHIARAVIILSNEVPASQAVITAVSNLEAALPPQGTLERADAFSVAWSHYNAPESGPAHLAASQINESNRQAVRDEEIERRIEALGAGDSNDEEIDGLLDIIRQLQEERRA